MSEPVTLNLAGTGITGTGKVGVGASRLFEVLLSGKAATTLTQLDLSDNVLKADEIPVGGYATDTYTEPLNRFALILNAQVT